MGTVPNCGPIVKVLLNDRKMEFKIFSLYFGYAFRLGRSASYHY